MRIFERFKGAINQAKIARELGVSRQYMNYIVNGQRRLPAQMAINMAQELPGKPSALELLAENDNQRFDLNVDVIKNPYYMKKLATITDNFIINIMKELNDIDNPEGMLEKIVDRAPEELQKCFFAAVADIGERIEFQSLEKAGQAETHMHNSDGSVNVYQNMKLIRTIPSGGDLAVPPNVKTVKSWKPVGLAEPTANTTQTSLVTAQSTGTPEERLKAARDRITEVENFITEIDDTLAFMSGKSEQITQRASEALQTQKNTLFQERDNLFSEVDKLMKQIYGPDASEDQPASNAYVPEHDDIPEPPPVLLASSAEASKKALDDHRALAQNLRKEQRERDSREALERSIAANDDGVPEPPNIISNDEHKKRQDRARQEELERYRQKQNQAPAANTDEEVPEPPPVVLQPRKKDGEK